MIIKYQHEVKERSKQRQKCTEKNQIYIHIYQPEEETANFRNFTKKQIINAYNTYRHTCNVYVNIYTYIKDTRRKREEEPEYIVTLLYIVAQDKL